MRVIVVGAGPGGLITLTNFQRMFKDDDDVEIVCYERRSEVGGEWVEMAQQQWPQGEDSASFPIRKGIHNESQMNTPTVLYPPHPDYEFPPGTKLYPARQDMLNYVQSLSEANNLEKYIKFDKIVSDISFDRQTSKFSMKIIDLVKADVADETCDFLLLCNGHYGLPRKANVDMTEFSGEWLYSQDMTDPTKLYGKRILVVGTSWAALDVVLLLNRPGRAKSVHLSWRASYPLFAAGANLASIHPQIKSAVGKTVRFEDGSSLDVDAVILCPGFVPTFPLVDELQLDFDEFPLGNYLLPLYKHLVHPKCPKLFIPGKGHLNALYLNHPQSIFIAKVIKGDFKLPSESEMVADISKFKAYWSVELPKLHWMSEEEKDRYFPVAEMELQVGHSYHDLCPDVPKMGPEYIRHIYYEFLRGLRNDTLNYKTYVSEFRPDPQDSSQMLPHLSPPKSF